MAGPVQFYEIVDEQYGQLDPPFDWLAAMRHIDSLQPGQRRLDINRTVRLGEVWTPAGTVQDQEIDARDLLFTCSGTRTLRPGEADWTTGATAPAPQRRGRAYVESIIAVQVRANVLGVFRFGSAAPRHSSVIDYVNAAGAIDPPLRLRAIPRPSVLEDLHNTGSIARRVEFTTGMSSLRRIVGDQPGLFRLARNARDDLDQTRVTVTYELDTRKRKRAKMGGELVNDGGALLRDAQVLAENLSDVDRGTVVLIDEEDERHEIDLAEVKLTVKWPMRTRRGADSIPRPEALEGVLRAYDEVKDHIDEVLEE